MKIEGTPKFERRIGKMEIGDTGFIVPWAFDPKTETLRLDYTVHEERCGTVDLPIERIGAGPTDFQVNIKGLTTDYRW